MSHGDKESQLEAFRRNLEQEGYDVVDVKPIHRRTISERIAGKDDDSIGFIVVNESIKLRGEEFDGDLVIVVYEDRLVGHGVDIYSHSEDPLPPEKRDLLTEIVPPQEIEDDEGKRQLVWIYYPPPEDLPDKFHNERENNINDLIEELESVYQQTP